jgi:hypothetical protein
LYNSTILSDFICLVDQIALPGRIRKTYEPGNCSTNYKFYISIHLENHIIISLTSLMAIDSLVSRAYQDELASYARENNAILAADTGTGKTLIAALVIRWKMQLERMKYIGDATPSNKMVSPLSVRSS